MRVREGILALMAAGAVPATIQASNPHVDYMLHCQGCHGADGRGSPGAVPSLQNQVGRFLRAPGGREYLIRVPGSAQSALGDAELAELLNWMIHGFGPEDADFTPFSAEEVSRHRARPLVDVEAVRRDLLRRIEAPRNAEGRP